jgi:cell division protein FtsI (penicillin-binding protein 3)
VKRLRLPWRRDGEPVDPLAWRRRALLAFFALGMVGVLGKAFKLQALERESWARAAEEQQRERVPLPARRGSIYDRDGVPLALSHETYRVSVAPRELRDRGPAARALRDGLGLSEAEARRVTRDDRRWVVLPGRYTAEQRRRLGEMRGVYFEQRLERFYPQGQVAREVIGVISGDDRALGGIEQQLDALLSGTPGYSVLRRDARGRALPTISLPVVEPVPGADVYLTIDLDLQEIADGALRQAIEETNASGGDLLIADPRTGELLAAVSRRGGRARSLAAITEPYEPGSTLKPFLAAALLQEGRAELADSVHGENGRWRDGRRTITDSHAAEWLSLHDVIRVSSNIGIIKFAQRLSRGETYAYLRDFGFGTGTGIEYPAESTGRLRRPAGWSALSQASLAMGYELSVTPLQLTAAYGALANGGVLMEPYLVREVRASDGTVLRTRGPQAVRRVIAPETARQLTGSLVAVVREGTATRAAHASFEVAGKTGTARRTGADGRYEAGSYTSSFAGYFPADDPQMVIFVKLDQPRGGYYGGLTAAPVTRETLQGLLAARSPAFDTRRLLATGPAAAALLPTREQPARPPSGEREGTFVFVLEEGVPQVDDSLTGAEVLVPVLEGLTLRDATRRAHAVGLRVRVQGSGTVAATSPAAGARLRRGETLTLEARAR